MNLENLVKKSQSGDKDALETVVLAVQDKIYYLSLRMLCNPEDAKEATQEIIIKILTKLSTFEHKSQFTTWVYKVATNYLLNTKKVLSKDLGLTFEMYKQDLEDDLCEPNDYKNTPEYPLLLNEIRIACTMAMLLCLDHKHRMTYIIGEILEIETHSACEILCVSPENYRQQLSRARKKISDFTGNTCGLISDCANCSCDKKLTGAISRGRVNVRNIVFANQDSKTYIQTLETIKQISNLKIELRTQVAHNSVPIFKSPEDFSKIINNLSK
jgi:RNA polymerase sigma factor (sigma-70 family)